jgi:hypothetical protein
VHKRLEETIGALDRERARLFEAVDRLDDESLRRKPAPDAWSGIEILEHVAATDAAIVAALGRALQKAKAAGLEPDYSESSVFASLAGLAIEPGQARFEAPPRLRPSGTRTVAESLAALRDSYADLVTVLGEVDGYDLTAVRFPHPAFGELNAYQWVAVLAKHLQRHVDQLLAVTGHAPAGEQPAERDS